MADLLNRRTDFPADFTRHVETAPRLAFVPFGLALSLFLAITFLSCVGHDVIFSGQPMHLTWAPLLPGFVWLSWGSLFVGLMDSLAYGWFIALIFVPLFNFFSVKFER